jgi:hypothetical protein
LVENASVVATREDVYLAFGRLAELAQLFETELGTALLGYDALERKAYIQPDPDAYRRLQDAISAKTLGATLKAIRSQFDVQGDLGELFDRALTARNALTHGFFLHHGMAIHSDAGRDAMMKHLDELRASLEPAYQAAGNLAQILLSAMRLLKKVHAH